METTYWILALAGTTVFVLKLAMMFLGFGQDHDLGDAGDVGGIGHDFDGDGQVGHGAESTMMFTFLSLQSLATFFMGCGWMGLVALKTWNLDDIAAALCAAGFGVFCVVLLGKLLQQAMKLESSGNVDIRSAVGSVGTVYSRIAEGRVGKVQIEVQGRLRTLDARTSGAQLDTGATVKVDEVDGAGVLVVSASH